MLHGARSILGERGMFSQPVSAAGRPDTAGCVCRKECRTTWERILVYAVTNGI